jgi:hypothetical protein
LIYQAVLPCCFTRVADGRARACGSRFIDASSSATPGFVFRFNFSEECGFGKIFLDAQQLNLKVERRVGRDLLHLLIAVRELWWHQEPPLAAHPHANNTLVDALHERAARRAAGSPQVEA